MDADRDSNAPQPEISPHVGSCVIRVRELDPSLKFYCDVFSCNVAVRETDMALLVAPDGFHIYLHAPSRRRRAANTAVCTKRPYIPLPPYLGKSAGWIFRILSLN